ncbi:hypothetical protein Ahy_A01g002326 [Arachis hypogaea]|uniref:Aminotransferase-like plant mobile domain-containing protein n=1 Tax=Arachis hypogaea TaxID=3818 RepID=A0A445EQW0_ARAHY|nr:hypothetical protein Ahy_A01g002326 [Arachis hypogaea]
MCHVANKNFVMLAGPLQLLQSWIFWRFPGFRPAGYDTFGWPLASIYDNVCLGCRWLGHNPTASEKGPRLSNTEYLMMTFHNYFYEQFTWIPYSSHDVVQVVHLEILEPWHTTLWRSVTMLIYFAVIEWHQVDRVLPLFGGVQPRPRIALDIGFLMVKDGRGGDQWSHTTCNFGTSNGPTGRIMSFGLMINYVHLTSPVVVNDLDKKP